MTTSLFSIYQKLVSYMTLIIFVITSNAAMIRVSEAAGYISVGGVSQSYTPLAWDVVATTNIVDSTTQVLANKYVTEGLTDFVNVAGNGSAKALGMTAAQIAEVINLFPANVPMIFGRYGEGINEGVIDIFKVEKYGTTAKLLHAYFTPENGSYWAANRTYADPSTKLTGANGPNPFAAFKSTSDHKFHNASFAAVITGVGHAMRMMGTPFALIVDEAYTMEKVGPKCKKKAGGLRKTCKVWVYGKSKPSWYFATPQSMTNGDTVAICALSGVTTCPPYAIAPAMVSFEKKTGGNLDESSQTIYTWYKKYSGWTVLAFVLAVFVISAAIAFAGGLQGVSFLSNMINGTGVGALPGLNLGGGYLGIAAVEAAGYAIGAAVFQGGGLTDIQSGFYGKVQDGYSVAPSASGVQERGTRSALRSIGLDSSIYGGLNAVRKTAGVMIPEASDYVEHNSTSFYTDNGSPIQGSSSNTGVQ